MDLDLNKLVNKISKVTLKGGLFAKTCSVIIVIGIVLGFIAHESKDIWTIRGCILIIFILTFTFHWKLIAFANKNPQAAILEGAEFLIHEQMQLAAKGIPVIPQDIKSLAEDKPISTDTNIEVVDTPDEDNEEGVVTNG